MRTRKNTLVLFSKVPEEGMVKTRLTVLKDGIFAPDDACALYRCMLFDVVEIICLAMNDLEREAKEAAASGADVLDTYGLVVSTVPESNVPVMEKLLSEQGFPREVKVIFDEGASFDEHYNCSFEKAWADGADCVLSMGADMPALTKRDVRMGFEALHRLDGVERGGIVISPDQEMGVSVVGWTRETDFDHSGVYYCCNGLTVLPAYIQKAQDLGLPALWLPPVPDVDTIQDLQHNITLVEALCYCSRYDDIAAPWRTHQWLTDMGLGQVRVMPNDLHDPRTSIDGSEPEQV